MTTDTAGTGTPLSDTIAVIARLWSNTQGVFPDFVVVPADEAVALSAEAGTTDRITVSNGVPLVYGVTWGAGMDFPVELLRGAEAEEPPQPEPSRIILPH
jgi:hypothetical protein